MGCGSCKPGALWGVSQCSCKSVRSGKPVLEVITLQLFTQLLNLGCFSAQWRWLVAVTAACSSCPDSCWGERGSGCLTLPVLCDRSVPRRGRPQLCAAQPFALPGIFGSALFVLKLVIQCVQGVGMKLGWPVSA